MKGISEYLLDRVRLRKSVNMAGVMEDQFVYFNDNSPPSYRLSIVTKFEARNARNTINQTLYSVYLLPGDFPISKTKIVTAYSVDQICGTKCVQKIF